MTARKVEPQPMANRYTNKEPETIAKAGHISIDLETLSTKTRAVVLSIAIVCDNGRELEMHPDLDYQMHGLDRHVDSNTLLWWFGQKESVLNGQSQAIRLPVPEVIYYTRHFLDENIGPDTLVWGNAPSFDCEILASFLGEKPWKFYQERDVRTARMITGRTKPDVAHDALSDARAQLQDALRYMKMVDSQGE